MTAALRILTNIPMTWILFELFVVWVVVIIVEYLVLLAASLLFSSIHEISVVVWKFLILLYRLAYLLFLVILL